jgi:hypothetical protein
MRTFPSGPSKFLARFLAGSLVGTLSVATALSFGFGCSSRPPRTTPKLSELEGKRIALVEVGAEPTQRAMIEVALVNQLQSEGTFELIAKEEIQKAKAAPDVDTTDLQALGRSVGADYLLQIEVLALEATERSGVDRITVEDSQLAEEQGEDARQTTRLVKVKSLTGKVSLKIRFTPVRPLGAPATPLTEPREAVATQEDRVTAREEKTAIRLPGRIRFLETLIQKAFSDFFKQYKD